MGNIDESHAAGIIGEHQQVAGEDQARFFNVASLKFFIFLITFLLWSAWVFFNPGIYVFEEVCALFYQSAGRCFVHDCPEIAHIKRNGVIHQLFGH